MIYATIVDMNTFSNARFANVKHSAASIRNVKIVSSLRNVRIVTKLYIILNRSNATIKDALQMRVHFADNAGEQSIRISNSVYHALTIKRNTKRSA